jgi:hypothetical protein
MAGRLEVTCGIVETVEQFDAMSPHTYPSQSAIELVTRI